MPAYELNLRDYWRIIKKKKVIVIVTVIMLSSFSFFFAMMNKPTPLYRATATLKIERSTDLTGLYMYSVSWGSGDDLATRAEVIKSFPMIEKAAQLMGLLDSSLTPAEIRSNQQYFSIVEKLKARVKTEQEGYTNLINIIVTDYVPQRATDLANALAQVYVKESFNEKNAQAIRALQAIQKQLRTAENNFKEAERKVRRFKEQNKLLILEGTATRLSNNITETENRLEQVRSDISQIDNILFEIDQNPEYIYYLSLDLLLNRQNTVLKAIQGQMNELATKRREYLQHYTVNHPIIVDLDQQIKNREQRFINELKTFRETLVQTENNIYERWKSLSNDYRQLPLLDFNLANMERELEINKQIYQQLEVRHQEALIKQSELVHEVFLVRPAFLPTSPINPTMVGPTTAIGTVIGIILGIVLAFVAETLDTTFSTIDDIEKTLDTKVVGIVPFVDIEDIKEELLAKIESPVPDEILQMQARLVSHYNPKSTMAESFRALRTNIHFGMIDKGYKSLMVTSSVAAEGKTTIAVNLAVSMAQIGMNTLLVEADLRKPRISKLFGIEREPGITDVVLKRDNLEEVIRTMSDLMMGTMATDTFRTDNIPGIEYLNILTAGKHERNPSEIIASKLMNTLLSELKERYDLIIIDSAPVIQATDATVLGSKVDTVLLVYYQGKISRGTLRRSKSQLEMLKSDVIGVAINGMRADVSADYADYKYSYEYHYTYGEAKEAPENRYIKALRSFFLSPQEGLHATVFDKIRKWRLAGIAAALAVLIGGGCLITRAIKSSTTPQPPSETETIVTSDTAKQDIQVTEIIPTPEVPQAAEISEPTPEELKQLKEQFGVEDKTSGKPATVKRAIQPPPTTQPRTAETVPIKPSPTKESKPGPTPARIEQRLEPRAVSPTATTIPAETYENLTPSRPYSLVVHRCSSQQQANQTIRRLKQSGLKSFISYEFPDESSLSYVVCYGNFADSDEAEQAAKRLRLLGFEGLFTPKRFPYSILLGKFPSIHAADRSIRNYPQLSEYHFIQKATGALETGEYYSLLGAFESAEIAGIFLHKYSDLSSFPIVLK